MQRLQASQHAAEFDRGAIKLVPQIYEYRRIGALLAKQSACDGASKSIDLLASSPLRIRASFAHDIGGVPDHAGGLGACLGESGWVTAFGAHGKLR
jgi:hypothetical protein